MAITLERPATSDCFDDQAYLAANPDVAAALARGQIKSPRSHFERHGHREGRKLRFTHLLQEARKVKAEKFLPFLDLWKPHLRLGDKFDYLTDDLRQELSLIDVDQVSSHEYGPDVKAMIERNSGGLVLDFGAGRRPTYYENVVNLEVVDYDTTDIRAAGEYIPFKDGTFDAVVSIAVLEHVTNPWRCAEEIIRVLKPGGELFCSVPFLQPLHGYPHHYFNMTHQGLARLFHGKVDITDQKVSDGGTPIWWLTWALSSWAEGLPESARRDFLSMTIGDIAKAAPSKFLSAPFVVGLPAEKNFELAASTTLIATKRR